MRDVENGEKTMEKEFAKPELEIIRFDDNDVIATSGCTTMPGNTNPDEG